MPPPSIRRLVLISLIAAASIVAAGCGGSKDKREPVRTQVPPVARVEPLDERAASRLKPRMPKQRVLEVLRQDPVLTQAPTEGFPGGCIFYPIARAPLANVWQFCFNREGLSLLLTAYSPNQPDPPAGASPARAVLLGRADTICQSDYGKLEPITERLRAAIARLAERDTRANFEDVDRALDRLGGNLDGTYEQLRAFAAPEDGRAALTAYLESLRFRSEAVADAREAASAGDLENLARSGSEYDKLGADAKRQAKEYGFATCSAPVLNLQRGLR